MRKDKIQEAMDDLVNKMLEKHLVTVEDVLNDETWYDRYSWTKRENDEFRDWAIGHLRKKLRWNIARATKEVGYFLLCYGLKII
jgi:hypothetical protein